MRCITRGKTANGCCVTVKMGNGTVPAPSFAVTA